MSRRKVEMILELVDRATRPAQRFIALQRRMGAAVERANRIATRTARLAGRATDLYKRAVQGLGRAQDALQRGIRRSNDLIRRQVTQMRMATGMMRGGVMGMGRAALLAGGMFTAYAGTVSLAASSFLGPARQFENFGVQLESIEGSSAKAKAAMGWIEDFSTRTPLELNQVVEAYQQMKTFGMDPTNGSMMALVDTMAASGKGAEQLNGLVLALGKSWTKGKLQGEEIMMLLERGVPVWDMLAAKTGKSVEQLQKMSSAGKLGRREIQLLIDAMAEKNAGASEKMSRTWDGIISNLIDWWTRFQRTVMGFGVFDWMKDRLRGVLDILNAMESSGELEVWAKAIADHILIGLNAIWDFGAAAVRTWQRLYPWLERAADTLGGWRNLALALIAIPFRGVIFGALFALLQFAGGAGLAMKALAGIGFGSAATGAMWFGKALLGLANPINWVKGAFLALRVALISTGIGALVVGLAMAGVWIYNNWSGLKSFFKGFGQAFMKSLGPARPLVESVIRNVRMLWDWIGRLVGPLDASAQQWEDWGRSVGRIVAGVVTSVQRFFGWFGNFSWSNLLSADGLKSAWDALWSAISPVNWGDYISEINWLALIGGAFFLRGLIRPIIWTAKLIGAPIKWALLGGKFALSTLIKPIVWGAGLIAKIPWLALAGGGSKFALKGLLTALKWTTRLIPGIGWALLAGELAWHLLIKPMGWDAYLPKIDWQRVFGAFSWNGWLPEVNWSEVLSAVSWPDWVSEFSWDTALRLLDWATFLLPIRWLEFIPGFSWGSVFDLLNIEDFIPEFAWSDLLPSWDWSSIIPDINLGKYLKRPAWLGGGDTATETVQARARGGSFGAGWLLTGENGPELEYRDRGGYIAHNRALQNMVAMSGTVARNAANANRTPKWLKGAALASGIAASAALPAAADNAVDMTDLGSAPTGAQYLNLQNSGPRPPDAPISVNMTFTGKVDREVMPDIRAIKEELLEELQDLLEDSGRAAQRREHE